MRRRLISGRYGAGLLGVPVGGGPPASRPRRELRSARRLEARPGPAGLAAASNRAVLGIAGPAAREARRPHVVRRRASKPARALRSLRPLHTCGAGACLLEARPGPAGLASAFTHIAAELPQCRMQFPCDSFKP